MLEQVIGQRARLRHAAALVAPEQTGDEERGDQAQTEHHQRRHNRLGQRRVPEAHVALLIARRRPQRKEHLCSRQGNA